MREFNYFKRLNNEKWKEDIKLILIFALYTLQTLFIGN